MTFQWNCADISRLTHTMDALAQGRLETEVVGANRTDELGAMAKAVEVFKLNALRVTEMTEAAETIESLGLKAYMSRAACETIASAHAGTWVTSIARLLRPCGGRSTHCGVVICELGRGRHRPGCPSCCRS